VTPALEPGTADVLASLANAGAQRLGGVELPQPRTSKASVAAAARSAAARAEPAARATTALGEPVYGPAEAADVQGFVLPGFNKDHQRLVFLRFGQRRRAQAFLRWIAPRISSMEEVLDFRREFRAARLRLGVADPGLRADGTRDPALTATWTSIALSHNGIALLLGEQEADRFGDESFRQGLAERSTYLGDPSDPTHAGHRERWVVGGPGTEADAVVTIAADVRADLDRAADALLARAARHGLTVLHDERGDNLPGALAGHEHFGFKDGISQPGVRGARSSTPGDEITPRLLADDDPRAGLFAKPGQPLLWPGQFLLGEPRQDTQDPRKAAAPTTAFPPWARRGSYVVVRRLAQDVPGFWDWATRAAAQVGVDPVRLASAFVGRWPSGAPFPRTPTADDPVLAGDDFASNHFLFQDDTRPSSLLPLAGYPGDTHSPAKGDVLARVCPHAAHIRKVNPRDSATDFGAAADTLLRLMLRRGIPYGPPVAGVVNPTPELVAAERGLFFVAVMASIEDQFEFVQRRWANASDQPNAGGPDPLIGQSDRRGDRTRTVTWPRGRRDAQIAIERDFVTPTGGGYFFAPPVSAVGGVLAGRP
jgi:Dyp-type peroxidase family